MVLPRVGLALKKCQGSSSEGGGANADGREIKESKEPWVGIEYKIHKFLLSYYCPHLNYSPHCFGCLDTTAGLLYLLPVTLPLRRPYSGNPEFLDDEEFGETSETITCNESSTSPAVELGLMEENLEASMIFLQLPENMPVMKQSVKKEAHEVGGTSKPLKGPGPSGKACGLDELPAGFMGKMLVYKSGAVKLKLGDILYDVSAGLNCVFAQDVAAINTEEKHCCIVGELNKRAILTPDVDSILENISDL